MKDKAPLLIASLAVIFQLSFYAYTIWAAINFILYLAKDKPFDWLPVWLFTINIVIIILLFFLALLIPKSKYQPTQKKSAFQSRLNGMLEKRNKAQKEIK